MDTLSLINSSNLASIKEKLLEERLFSLIFHEGASNIPLSTKDFKDRCSECAPLVVQETLYGISDSELVLFSEFLGISSGDKGFLSLDKNNVFQTFLHRITDRFHQRYDCSETLRKGSSLVVERESFRETLIDEGVLERDLGYMPATKKNIDTLISDVATVSLAHQISLRDESDDIERLSLSYLEAALKDRYQCLGDLDHCDIRNLSMMLIQDTTEWVPANAKLLDVLKEPLNNVRPTCSPEILF